MFVFFGSMENKSMEHKKGNCDFKFFLSHNSEFFSRNCKFTSHNSVIN